MCRISSVNEFKGSYLLGCDKCDSDFQNAKTLKIKCGNDEYVTDAFTVEKTRACFSEGGLPWIMLNGNVPKKYLQRGNEVLFS